MDSVPFSVVDCETTGLGPRDRIVELAIVTVDPCTGEVVDEFETIVNPGRDVGPVDIHGISAEMASMAPRFEEVAPVVAARLNHSTVVAHNLAFDLRMLGQEFARVNTSIDWGDGICTMRATGLALGHAARAVGVRLSRHHRALNDARAAAAIVVDLGVRRNGAPCCIGSSKGQESCRTLRRDAFGVVIDVPIRRWARAACIPSSVEACVEYFDLLEHVLADLALSNAEAMELKSLRESIGLRDSQVRSMHEAYFESLRLAACSDGVVTARERELLQSVAHALGISRDEVPESNEKPRPVRERCLRGYACASLARPSTRMVTSCPASHWNSSLRLEACNPCRRSPRRGVIYSSPQIELRSLGKPRWRGSMGFRSSRSETS